MPSTKSEHTPGICTGANGSDDTDWVLQGASTEFSQPLLWVHQNEWQKELLVKYGNVITLKSHIEVKYATVSNWTWTLFSQVYICLSLTTNDELHIVNG